MDENTTTGRRAATSASSDEGTVSSAVASAQDAAGKVRDVAGTAAERLPGAVASAQVAVSDTARALDELPEQTLVLGTTFSLGLGVGMFLTGTNRLLVLLAMLPAVAMAATLMGRDERGAQALSSAAAATRRATNRS